MSAWTLGVIPGPAKDRVDAWFVLGADPGVWLAMARALQLDAGVLRVFPVPRSRSDARACGALILYPSGVHHGLPVERALALVRVGSGLHLPGASQLYPPMDPSEVDALLGDRVGLLLPGGRFVAFARSDVLELPDLIEPPQRLPAGWLDARPGIALAPKLVSIDVEQAPLMETLREEGDQETATLSLDELELPKESRARTKPGDAVRGLVARMLIAFTNRFPRGGKERNWVDELEGLAHTMLSRALLEKRSQQLARLLELLEKDPELGLRFALPLTGHGGRGLARPGDTLGRRTVEYGANRDSGAAPVDSWNVDQETNRQLAQRYRALAHLEIERGRYRRAAYILAELLGDHRAAAQALFSGRYFLEAAELYREILHDRVAAADCLEKGGVLLEALKEWRAIGNLERTAALLERLERHEEARAVHRERVRRRLDVDDVLGAARILEHDLHSVDEALELLSGAWPEGAKLEDCLTAYFDGLARHGRQEEALCFLRDRAGAVPPARAREPWLGVLTKLARKNARTELGVEAQDAARVLVGRLIEEGADESLGVLEILSRGAGGDRLLVRDVTRCATRVQQDARVRGVRRGPSPRARIEQSGEFKMRVHAGHGGLVGDPRYLFAIGEEENGGGAWLLEVYSWYGRRQAVWRWPAGPGGAAICRLLPGQPAPRILAAELGSTSRLQVDARHLHRMGVVEAGTPPWTPPHIRGLCPDATGGIWIAHEGQIGCSLRHFDSRGLLLGTWETDFAVEWNESRFVSLAVLGDVLYASLGSALWRIDGSGLRLMPFNGGHLIASEDQDRRGLVVVSEKRCHFYPESFAYGHSFGHGQPSHATFLRNGCFLQAFEGGLTAHRIEDRGVREVLDESRALLDEPVVGLVPAQPVGELGALEGDDGFALIGASGQVRCFRLLGRSR